MKSILHIIVLLVCWHYDQRVQATTYRGHSTEYLLDCPGRPNDSLGNLFDASNLEVEWTDDGEMQLHGYVVCKQDVNKEKTIESKVSTMKKIGEKWLPSGPTLVFKDFCKNMFDPKEIWGPVASHFAEDQRVCPPKKGTKYFFDHQSIVVTVNAGPGLQGEYKLVLEFKTKDKLFCGVMQFLFTRIK